MSKLKKATVAGLIEKLVDDKYISQEEASTFQKLLEESTDGMTKDEISSVINNLDNKLEATDSTLKTQNGLNYAIFESEVKSVTQRIIKSKNDKKNQQANSQESEEKNPTDENKNEKKKDEQAEEQAEREATIRNMNSIKNVVAQFPEFSEFEFPEESLEELGKAKTKFDKVIDEAEELRKEHPELSREKAVEIATQKYGVDMDSGEMQVAMATRMAENVEEMVQERHISHDEAFEIIVQSDSNVIGVFAQKEYEEAKKTGKKLTCKGFLQKTLAAGFQKFFGDKSKEKNSEIESLEKDGWYLNLEELRDCIAAKEEMERCFTWWRNINVNKEEIEIDYTKLTDKYLCTDQSISQIYEQLKQEDPKLDLKFNDVLNGIIENIGARSNSPDAKLTLSSIRKAEESRRVYEQFMKSLNIAKGYSKDVGGINKELNDKIQNELEEKNISDIALAKEIKDFWIERTKIDLDRYREENTEDSKENDQGDEPQIEKLEKDRDRIIRDRNQVIKLSKELGISTDEAAKRYFEENPKRLKQYSIKERRILLGKNNRNVEEIELSFVLKKLGFFIKKFNDRVLSIAEVDRIVATKKIASLQDDIGQPYELKKALNDLTKAEERIKKCGKIKALLERGTKKKDAKEILEDKIKKEKEKEIFKTYLMTGKSATEILRELNKDGNEYTINDVINIIAEGARNHLKKNELKFLIVSENAIYERTNELESIENSKRNAEEKGLTDWVNDYEEQIKNITEKKEFHQNRTNNFRVRMQKRMGILGPNKKLLERKKEIEDSKNQTEFSEERNDGQENNGDSHPKSKIELGSIKTGGQKHNVKAIAQKGKVTPRGIKGMFAKIKSLYGDPKKAKSEEQKGTQEEKSTTSTEGIR